MNYKKVIDDYKSGAIDREQWMLRFDNDGGYWEYIGPISLDDIVEELQKDMEKRYGSPSGYEDLVDIACAAGIEAEWV